MQQFVSSLAAALLICPWSAAANDMPPTVPMCALCHGQVGPSPFPGVPTIHGLPAGVISSALFKYREDERPCRKSECASLGSCPDMAMCDIAGPMNDEAIEALAQWFAGQPFVPHQDPWDPDLAARGREIHDRHCEICHSNFGSDPVDDASMLRGQRKVYLRTALEDFRQGRRSVGVAAMDTRFREFADEDLDALAEFYSGAAAEPLPGE
jgi:sulfide dehydrogenase cytochrome subunit